MSTSKYALFSFRGFALTIIVLSYAICGSEAGLKTLYVEDLCRGWTNAYISLRHHNTAFLMSTNSDPSELECTIQLDPEPGSSVALSFYRYNLEPEDQLVLEDANKFKMALLGEGDFPDEGKTFESDGLLTIHYFKNSSRFPPLRGGLKFQFVFTRLHDTPCRYGEFECRNKKCIPNNLLCDGHNHCGDNSNQEECGPKYDVSPTSDYVTIGYRTNAWMITIVVVGAILGIVVITFCAVFIRGVVKKKKASAKGRNLPSVAADVPQSPTAPPAATAPPPSAFQRIRQSFRSLHRSPPKPQESGGDQQAAAVGHPEPDNYQVPSMYPHLASAPHLSGVDNPVFKGDV